MSTRELFPGVAEQMRRMLYRASEHRCRIIKWRLSYTEAWGLATELSHLSYVMKQSPVDILGSMMDGNVWMFGIKVELR